MQNLNNDKPIEDSKEDLLGRDAFAEHVANTIKCTSFSNNDSFVFGLYGKWGEGKTSFINLLKSYLVKYTNNKQNKNPRNVCLFVRFLNLFFKIHLFIFVLLFSFEDFLFKYDVFQNIFSSTYSIIYNVYFFSIVSFVIKLVLCFGIIRMPNIFHCDFILQDQSDLEDNIRIVDFSPWNMTDEKILLENFFIVIKRELFQTIGSTELNKNLTKYMNAVIRKCSNGIIDFDIFKEKNILKIKKDIINELKIKTKTKIIVFIDDIDRLEDEEICLIFKLVKSIADLPNISYFLSFDKNIVVTALSKHHEKNGESYLEKIIQVPFSLPQIRGYKLEDIIQKEIEKFVNKNPEIEEIWEERYGDSWKFVFFYKLFSVLADLRDVKRYINLLKINYNNAIKNEVNIIDFFILSILQLKYSNLYNFVKMNKSFFIESSQNANSVDTYQIEKYKNELNKILDLYNIKTKEQLIKILYFLFPSIRRLYDNIFVVRAESENTTSIYGRICSSENFDKFFGLDCDENDISLSEMSEYISLIKDEQLFTEKLIELNKQKKLKIFLQKFEEYIAENVDYRNVQNIIKSFFNKGDYFDSFSKGFFDADIEVYIYRIVTELLKKKEINNPIEIIKYCIRDNESIFQSITFLNHLFVSLNQNNQCEFKNVNKENIKPLVDSVLKDIYSLASNDIKERDNKEKIFDGHIIKHPKISAILWFWYKNGNINELKNYVQIMTNTNKKLLVFLDNISSVSHVSNGNKSWYEKKLKKDDLELYFDVDKLKEKLELIEDSSLSEKEKEIKKRAMKGVNTGNYLH